ncbi:MAG: serpin family protein [Candidatus Coprovivens sp.]
MQTHTKKSNKLLLKIIILLLIIANVSVIAIKFSNAQKKEETTYFTGEILKPNHSANLVDYLDDNENIVISPININTSINKLYNMNINNESISSYLSLTLEESNELESTINSSLNIVSTNKTEIDDLYISYITILNNYRNYTIDDINDLSPTKKEELLLLLHKTSISYDTITGINISSKRYIENYKLTKEQYNINSYAIYEMIITCLDNYETYTYQNKITNYSETIYNNDLLIKPKKRKKQQYPEIDNVTLSGVSYNDIQTTTQTINNKIKEQTNNKVKYIVNEDEINKNELYQINTFNFESIWEENFSKEYIWDNEFTTFDNHIEIVEMLYEKQDFYLENKHAYGFIKDFEGSKYSFIGILPKEEGNFTLSSLNIESLLQNKVYNNTTISVPKFEIQYHTNLTNLYNKLGIENTNNTLELEHLSEQVTLNYMVSKISITIDEKGTNDSNIRSNQLETKDIDEESKQIYLNRPFAFLIIDNETNNVLLIGKVTNPNK